MCSHLVPSSSQVVWSREPMAPDSCTTLPWPCPGNLVLLSCVRCPWVTGSWRGRWWCTARNRIFIFYASHCSQLGMRLVLVINGQAGGRWEWQLDMRKRWLRWKAQSIGNHKCPYSVVILDDKICPHFHSELIDKEGNLVFIHSLTWTTERCIK